jgi:hypothetical protein
MSMLLYCSSPAERLTAWANAHPTRFCEQVSHRQAPFDFAQGRQGRQDRWGNLLCKKGNLPLLRDKLRGVIMNHSEPFFVGTWKPNDIVKVK